MSDCEDEMIVENQAFVKEHIWIQAYSLTLKTSPLKLSIFKALYKPCFHEIVKNTDAGGPDQNLCRSRWD